MAQQVTTLLIDDLDESKAVETISFSLDGSDYEIDLNAKNAKGIRKAFDPYVASGRKVTHNFRSKKSPGKKTVRRRTPAVADVDNATVRQWAIENNYSIGAKGRIPKSIIEAYRAA